MRDAGGAGNRGSAAKALGSKASREITQVKKHVMSAAARAKIGKATKARWARFRAGKNKKALGSSTIREVAQVKKRVLSAAARAKISKATKARWAKFRPRRTRRQRLRLNRSRLGSLFRWELDVRQCLSTKLNFLNRHWSQHKQAEENENKTSLPLLWPPPPQIDSYCADCSTE